MTVTISIPTVETARMYANGWAARDLRCLLLDETSTYSFDATDETVADVLAAGGVEATWTGYARTALAPSTPTLDGSDRWQLLVATCDFGVIGTAVTDECAGVIVYDENAAATDADRLFVAHAEISPVAAVWDGTTNFRVTFPGTGAFRVGAV